MQIYFSRRLTRQVSLTEPLFLYSNSIRFCARGYDIALLKQKLWLPLYWFCLHYRLCPQPEVYNAARPTLLKHIKLFEQFYAYTVYQLPVTNARRLLVFFFK